MCLSFVLNQHFNVGLFLDIDRPISFKLDFVIETTKLYIFISVWMVLIFIQCHSCMRNQKLMCPFSVKFHS